MPWLVTPILVPILLSWVVEPAYVTRYSIGASPSLLLLLARGVRTLSPIEHRKPDLVGGFGVSVAALVEHRHRTGLLSADERVSVARLVGPGDRRRCQSAAPEREPDGHYRERDRSEPESASGAYLRGVSTVDHRTVSSTTPG